MNLLISTFTTRDRFLVALLWLSVLAQATWVGGTLYQMLVIVPIWSASPPESVQASFGRTDYNRTIFNFFGPRFMIARNLALVLVLALLAGWHRPKDRNAFLFAVACFAFGVIFILANIYPINTVLFEQAGGGQSAEAVRAMARQWIFADRLRFAVGSLGFLAVLWAFRQPIKGSEEETLRINL